MTNANNNLDKLFMEQFETVTNEELMNITGGMSEPVQGSAAAGSYGTWTVVGLPWYATADTNL